MNKEIIVDTKLDMYDYLALVENLADGYFDESGEYIPHYGFINTLGMFYNYCVISSPWDEIAPRPVTDAEQLAAFITDDDFMAAYNKAIEHMYDDSKFDFATAVAEADNIVRVRSSSLEYSIQRFKNVCTELIDEIAPMLAGLNMDSLNEMTDKLQNLGITKEGLTDEYMAKQKEQVKAEQKAQRKNNVVPMKK